MRLLVREPPYQCVTGCDNQAYSHKGEKKSSTRLGLQIIAWHFLLQLYLGLQYIKSLAAIRPISCLNATFALCYVGLSVFWNLDHSFVK